MEKLHDLADRLDQLQRFKNDGRGISCVRAVIGCLRSGDFEGAKAVASNEGDKIGGYPDIEDFLIKHGIITKVDWLFNVHPKNGER